MIKFPLLIEVINRGIFMSQKHKERFHFNLYYIFKEDKNNNTIPKDKALKLFQRIIKYISGIDHNKF